MALIALFLSIVLLNSYQSAQSSITLSYYPTAPRPDQPVMVTALVRNTLGTAGNYSTTIMLNDKLVLATNSTLPANSAELFTYTAVAPPLGSVIKAYAEVKDISTGAIASGYLLIPQSPPEAWLSFVSLAAFSTAIISTTSTLTSTFTIAYYLSVVSGTGTQPVESVLTNPLGAGLVLSVVLISILMFLQFTDMSKGRRELAVHQLRIKYGFLAANLLLVFIGIVVTKVFFILVG